MIIICADCKEQTSLGNTYTIESSEHITEICSVCYERIFGSISKAEGEEEA